MPVSVVPRAVPIVCCVAAVNALLIGEGRASGFSSPLMASSAVGGKSDSRSFSSMPPLNSSAFSGSRLSMISSEVVGDGLAVVVGETEGDVEANSAFSSLKASAFSLSLSYCLVTCFLKRRYCRKDCIAVNRGFAECSVV